MTDDTCDYCGEPNDDGDGYAGYCSHCADLIQAHEDGDHTTSRDDCPTCEAGVDFSD